MKGFSIWFFIFLLLSFQESWSMQADEDLKSPTGSAVTSLNQKLENSSLSSNTPVEKKQDSLFNDLPDDILYHLQ